MRNLPLMMIMFFSQLWIACGYEPETSHISSQEPPIPIFILSGGYASCELKKTDSSWSTGMAAKIEQMYVVSQIHKLMERKYHGVKPRVLFSCYSALDRWSLFDKFKFRYSEDPKFSEFRETPLRESMLESNLFLSGYFSWIKDVVDQTRKQGPVELYIVGHSYGGWTAIQTAYHFHEYVKIGGLVTMDPISVLSCKARDMITQPFATLIQDHPDCLQSPNDQLSRQAISSLVSHATKAPGFWLNVFQKKFRFLHSDPIDELEDFQTGVNWEYRYTEHNSPKPRFGFLREYHSFLGRDPHVWQGIREQFFPTIGSF